MCTFNVSYAYAWSRTQMFWIYSSNFAPPLIGAPRGNKKFRANFAPPPELFLYIRPVTFSRQLYFNTYDSETNKILLILAFSKWWTVYSILPEPRYKEFCSDFNFLKNKTKIAAIWTTFFMSRVILKVWSPWSAYCSCVYASLILEQSTN